MHKTTANHHDLRWLVICDDETWRFRARGAARAFCRSLRAHPSNRDARRFGPYANVNGIPRVVDGWTITRRHDLDD